MLNIFDGILLGLVLIGAFIGFFRGVVSQLMALVGLLAAYFFASELGQLFAGFVQSELDCSRFSAQKIATLSGGILIYFFIRMVGYFIERLFLRRIKEFKGLNRVGGGFLGGVKAMVVMGILLCFVALVPTKRVRSWSEKFADSGAYALAVKFNPLGDPSLLERFRAFRKGMTDPKTRKKIQKDPQLKKLLSRYQLEGALEDQRFLEALKDGDFDRMGKNEELEKLMRDEELEKMLETFSSEPL